MDRNVVAVVGGGVIGLAVGWRAAQRGLKVTVVDPAPGSGASWAAAGMLAPVTEAHYGEERLLALNLDSQQRWPAFAAELAAAAGQDPGYRECGTVVVARDADDNAALDALFAFQQQLGLSVRRLRSREVRRLEPGLAPGARGGILVPGDHQVDNRRLVSALRAAAERAGVRFVREAAAAVICDGDRVEGVRLAGAGHVPAAQVVVAAGAHVARLEGLPDGILPVRPVKGQLLHLGPRPGQPAVRLAEHVVRGLDVYVVTRPDGRVVIGATVEEQGFDATVTAGAVHQLLRDAWELLPGVGELAFVEAVAGLRPGTPDNAPLLGPAGPRGLVLATGHYRNGVLLAPITADTVAALLHTGEVHPLLAPFDPLRTVGVAA